MLAERRRQKILELLHESPNGAISVPELEVSLGVSGMTVRRDLEHMEKMELLRRVHGGAVSRIDGLTAAPFTERRKEFNRAKAQIGTLAAQLVRDGDQIILDAGTTTLHIARRLAGKRDLTVVTNSISICGLLSRMSLGRVIVLGGEVRLEEECVIGAAAARQAGQYSVDKAFISAAGFSLEHGASDVFFAEVEVKQAMLKAAREAILVVDSTKWQSDRLIQIATLGRFQKIISDDGLPATAVAALRAAGIEVITAELNDEADIPTLEYNEA
jgi:DeoR/GlpR family transcriptional regulator of sugar metabolism